MKSSLKILLISTIAFILLFASVIVVKKVFVDKSSNDLVNINHLSSKFINKYNWELQEILEDYYEIGKSEYCYNGKLKNKQKV